MDEDGYQVWDVRDVSIARLTSLTTPDYYHRNANEVHIKKWNHGRTGREFCTLSNNYFRALIGSFFQDPVQKSVLDRLILAGYAERRRELPLGYRAYRQDIRRKLFKILAL